MTFYEKYLIICESNNIKPKLSSIDTIRSHIFTLPNDYDYITHLYELSIELDFINIDDYITKIVRKNRIKELLK
jgi:hypothetical protein